MKKGILFLMLSVLCIGQAMADPIEAFPVENISTYNGTAPFVYSSADGKFYAFNNLGQYEEYGVYVKTGTLKVASATNEGSEIQYIRTRNQSPLPYINLNYIPKANTRVVATMMSDTGDNWKAAFGCGYEQNGWKDRFCFFSTNATINLGGETGNRKAMYYYRKIVVDMDGTTGIATIYDADGTTVLGTITDSPKTADCKTPLYVFAQNKNYPDNSHIQTDCYNPYMTLYGMKIYEGETLVMDLVPYVTAEGKGGLKDKESGTVYTSANNGEFEISDDLGVTVYEGKLIYNTTDGHLYKYTNGSFTDMGVRTQTSLANEDYKNLNNWHTNDDHAGVFQNNIAYNNGSNLIDPYKGTSGWEPLMIKVPTEAGADYNFSFTYSGPEYTSHNGTQIHAFVWNQYNLSTDVAGHHMSDQVLATSSLPFAGATSLNYSLDFTAQQETQTLVYQFGSGSDNVQFWFQFDNLQVAKYGYPAAYEEIAVGEDPNKYTPLDYIESTGAARENVYTTPYKATSKTEVDIKFQSYSGGDWRAIFSGRNGSDSGNGISLYQNGNQNHFGYFVGGYKNDEHAPYPGHNQDITVKASLGNLNVNGTDYSTGRTEFNPSTRNISIFANPEWDQAFRGRIYYITIKEDGRTLYDFQPVMRHDGAFGYYDAATKTFLEPVQGNWNGYGYKKLDDKSYMTYSPETRIVLVGNTVKFLPDVQNLDGATYTWTSSDETKATVAADGTVTGIGAGTVTITVSTEADEGWTASYELTVSEPDYKRYDVNNVGYAVVTGGTGWNDSPVANLVDNNAATKFGCSGTGDAWAIIIASEPVAVQQYSFVTGGDTYTEPGRTPRSWKIEGSNDNQNWTTIDEQTQNYKAKTSNKEEFVFTVNGTDTYKFFKLTAWDFNSGFQLGELWINEQAHTWGEPTVTASTCIVPGKKVWECSDCHTLKTEALPLAEHTYENGVCTVCSGNVSEPVLLVNGATTPFTAKFRHMLGNDNAVEIEAGWNTADFDDSNWDELLLPLGTFGPYKTRWIAEHNTFWFRRPFNIDNPAAITKLTFKATHDDDYKVYINGVKVTEEDGWTSNENDWRTVEIEPADVNLVAGKNVLAVYIEQNTGGAYCDFSLEAELATSESVTVTNAGYATYCSNLALDFTDSSIKAFYATTESAGTLSFTQVNKVPAGTGVLLYKEGGTTEEVPVFTGAADNVTGNVFVRGTGAAVTYADNDQNYILFNGEDGIGFYKANNNNVATNRAYIHVTNGVGVKSFAIDLEDDATGISDLKDSKDLNDSKVIYNLAGQRLSKTQKGINIVNGKKIAVK